jgi:hypothetical protein
MQSQLHQYLRKDQDIYANCGFLQKDYIIPSSEAIKSSDEISEASFLGLFTIVSCAEEKSESLVLLRKSLNLATAFESSSVGGVDSMTTDEELL